MIYYEPIKVTINALGLKEVIINMVVRHHGVPKLLVTDQSLLFTSKFRISPCHFLEIKKKLFTAFYL